MHTLMTNKTIETEQITVNRSRKREEVKEEKRKTMRKYLWGNGVCIRRRERGDVIMMKPEEERIAEIEMEPKVWETTDR